MEKTQRQVCLLQCACVRASCTGTVLFYCSAQPECASKSEAKTMYVYAGVAPGYLVVFFLQMNILLLPDASVNREELYEVKLKSTTLFRSGVYRVITCARVNEFLVVWDLSFECKKKYRKIKAKTQHPCTALHRGQRNICSDLEVQRLGNNQCRTFKLLWPQPSPQKKTLCIVA